MAAVESCLCQRHPLLLTLAVPSLLHHFSSELGQQRICTLHLVLHIVHPVAQSAVHGITNIHAYRIDVAAARVAAGYAPLLLVMQVLLQCPQLQQLSVTECPQLETVMLWCDELTQLDLSGVTADAATL